MVMPRPTRHYRRVLLIIASALISIGLIAMVIVLALTDHGTAPGNFVSRQCSQPSRPFHQRRSRRPGLTTAVTS
jgi:hypothetical protein